MNEKRVKRILLGLTMVGVGIVAFGSVRRKKLLYKAVQDSVDAVAGNVNNPFGGGASGAACTLSQSKIDTFATELRSAVEIVSIFEGATDEDAILQTIASIGTNACMTRVSNTYQTKYGENLNLRIRSELSGKDLRDYETEILNLR
tara:strand:+ start:395 stop:832 length:438 start_codon:yes stop_codon:yes gene_type:complete